MSKQIPPLDTELRGFSALVRGKPFFFFSRILATFLWWGSTSEDLGRWALSSSFSLWFDWPVVYSWWRYLLVLEPSMEEWLWEMAWGPGLSLGWSKHHSQWISLKFSLSRLTCTELCRRNRAPLKGLLLKEWKEPEKRTLNVISWENGKVFL